ncbi:hypothetical protein D3C86_1708900 [compost metagenome]
MSDIAGQAHVNSRRLPFQLGKRSNHDEASQDPPHPASLDAIGGNPAGPVTYCGHTNCLNSR